MKKNLFNIIIFNIILSIIFNAFTMMKSYTKIINTVPSDYRMKTKLYTEKYWNHVTSDEKYIVRLGTGSKFTSFLFSNGERIQITSGNSEGSTVPEDYTEKFREIAYNSLSSVCLEVFRKNNYKKTDWINNKKFDHAVSLPHFENGHTTMKLFDYPDEIIWDDANDSAHFVSNCIGKNGGGINIGSYYTNTYGYTNASTLANWILQNNYAIDYKNFTSQKPEIGDVIIWKSKENNSRLTTIVINENGDLAYHTVNTKEKYTYETFQNENPNKFVEHFFHFIPKEGKLLLPPIPITPIGNITQEKPIFSWTNVEDAKSYVLEIDGVKYSVNKLSIQSRVTEGTHEWKVKAIFYNSLETDWSAPVTFSIVFLPPKLLYPCGENFISKNDNIYIESLYLKWEKVPNASSYLFEIFRNDELLVNKEVSDADDFNTSGPKEILDIFGIFFTEGSFKWRVQSKKQSSLSEWSSFCFFTIKKSSDGGGKAKLLPPKLIYPCGETYTLSSDDSIGIWDSYKWETISEAKTYTIQLYLNSNFMNEYEAQEIGSGQSFNVISVDDVGTWKWRMRSNNSTETSEWSEFCEYYVKISEDGGGGSDEKLLPPKLKYPCGETIELSKNNSLFISTYTWEKVNKAKTYTIQIYKDEKLESEDLIPEEHSILMIGLEDIGDWKWRVKSNNSNETSEWSNFCYFKVKQKAESLKDQKEERPDTYIIVSKYLAVFMNNTADWIREKIRLLLGVQTKSSYSRSIT